MFSTVHKRTLSMVLIAMFAVIIAVCSWISIPGPVPFTLQTFAVFFTLFFLGGKRGSAAVVLYILLGAVGVPVFAGFKSGLGALLGPTGGYIFGFVWMALVYWLIVRLCGQRLLVKILAACGGMLIMYAFGTLQFMLLSQSAGNPYTLGAALWLCVLPFVPIDLAKLFLSVVLCERVSRVLRLPL